MSSVVPNGRTRSAFHVGCVAYTSFTLMSFTEENWPDITCWHLSDICSVHLFPDVISRSTELGGKFKQRLNYIAITVKVTTDLSLYVRGLIATSNHLLPPVTESLFSESRSRSVGQTYRQKEVNEFVHLQKIFVLDRASN